MSFADLTRARYSCRSYEDRAIEPEKLAAVVEAGRIAPSAHNNHPTRIVICDTPELKEKAAHAANRFAKDGSVIIGCGNDKLWKLLATEMGQPELVDDPDYKATKDRVAHHEQLKVIVENWTKDQTVEEVADRLTKIGVPSCPIMTIDKIVKDPHIAGARKMFVDVEHPVAGHTTLTGDQIKFNDWEQAVRLPAPTLGQHNEEVYGKMLGFDAAKVHELMEQNVL